MESICSDVRFKRGHLTESPQLAIAFDQAGLTTPDGRTILQSVTLQVATGSTTALLGRSGSGKTTLLRMVNRLIEPTAGRVMVEAKATTDWDPITLRRSIGYVIQETGLFPHFDAERNIGTVLEIEGHAKREIALRVRELFGHVGLEYETFARRLPYQLSGGQRQRVGLARALAAEPRLLLMDEPFGALDPLTRAEMQDMLQALLKRFNKTVLLVTHDLDEALFLASHIVLMEAGQVVADLAAKDFLASQIPAVRSYVHAVHRGTSGERSRALMASFLAQHASEIAELTLEHLWLTGSALGLAAAIGVPTGIWLTRHPRWAKPVLGVVNIIQTIPSLALFGFLLPVPWLGERAARIAIAALTAYALLPIVRNTYAGIGGVDPTLLEVAKALGMTRAQRLRKVELPLAASFIFAGLRTATVLAVGIATIAAAVGAGGLGEFIFRGVASVDNRLVLAGAIPAALLAIAADAGLGWVEKRLRVPAPGRM